MSLARWLRQSPLGRAIASRLGAGYIRLVTRTTRWQVEGKEVFDDLVANEPGGIIATIWHGRLFMSPTYAPVDRRKTVAMISQNHDGQLIADIVGRFRVEAVRGSTYDRAKRRQKGGLDAYNGALSALNEERAVVAITPDGPRGPRMRAQSGAAQLSVVTNSPVIPIAFATSNARMMRSWDRFLLPLPFARGAIVYGKLLRPEQITDPAAYRLALEEALTEATNRADRLCGRDPVPPGPPIEDSPAAATPEIQAEAETKHAN